MTRIVWGDPTDRLYEYGIDRGVFYPNGVGQPGVPWNSLISIDETPVGGESTPYYYDGVKYLDVISSVDYQAQLTALSAPEEFAPCEGMALLAAGLFATNQPRQTFGFSYRTRIGSAANPNLGYKLHLVYNCTALPSSRSYSTKSDTVAPGERSWTFDSVPANMGNLGVKPTAHLIIDSRFTGSYFPGGGPEVEFLADLEEVLYGNDLNDPFLPDPSGVHSLLTI